MYNLKEEMKDKADNSIRYKGGKSGESGKSKSQINAEYFQALEQWLNDVRSYRYFCSFFPGFPYTMMVPQMNGFSTPPAQNISTGASAPSNQGYGMFMFPNHQQQPARTEEVAVEYIIPPLWKRFIAETVDFILLFIMKLAITFIAVDFFNFIDLERYESLHQSDKFDIKSILEVTSEITYLEVVHRLIVCLYEGIFLRRGFQNQVGGATPGKTFMGIRVVFCNSVEQVENQPNVIKVTPARDLGFGWAFARALLKNLVHVHKDSNEIDVFDV